MVKLGDPRFGRRSPSRALEGGECQPGSSATPPRPGVGETAGAGRTRHRLPWLQTLSALGFLVAFLYLISKQTGRNPPRLKVLINLLLGGTINQLCINHN